MSDAALIVCLNCEHRFAGAYCPRCGQKSSTGRLRLGEILGDVVSQIFNMDAKVPRTIAGLTTAPGRVCRDYVQGRRVGYVPPFRYCLTLLTLTVLFNLAIGFDPASVSPRTDFSPLQEEILRIISGIAMRPLDLVIFAVLPAFILVVRLLFRKSGYTYAEVSSFVLFIMGHIMFLGLFLAPLKILLPGLGIGMKLIMQLGYFSWAATVFFEARVVVALLKSLAATVIYLLLVMVAMTLLVLPAVISAVRSGAVGLE